MNTQVELKKCALNPEYIILVIQGLPPKVTNACVTLSRKGHAGSSYFGYQGWQAEEEWLTPEQSVWEEKTLYLRIHANNFGASELSEQWFVAYHISIQLKADEIPVLTLAAFWPHVPEVITVAGVKSALLDVTPKTISVEEKPAASIDEFEEEEDTFNGPVLNEVDTSKVLRELPAATRTQLQETAVQTKPKKWIFGVAAGVLIAAGAVVMSQIGGQTNTETAVLGESIALEFVEEDETAIQTDSKSLTQANLSDVADQQNHANKNMHVDEILLRALAAIDNGNIERAVDLCNQAILENVNAAMMCGRWFDPAQTVEEGVLTEPQQALEYYQIAINMGLRPKKELILLQEWLQKERHNRELLDSVSNLIATHM